MSPLDPFRALDYQPELQVVVQDSVQPGSRGGMARFLETRQQPISTDRDPLLLEKGLYKLSGREIDINRAGNRLSSSSHRGAYS